MKSTIKVYTTNIDLFLGNQHFNMNIDFQDNEFFEDSQEVEDYIDENVPKEIQECENYEEIREQIESALDIYRK